MTAAILSILVLAGLFALAWGIRGVVEDMRGLEGTDAASKTTEERKNEKIRKEIEKWREGQ